MRDRAMRSRHVTSGTPRARIARALALVLAAALVAQCALLVRSIRDYARADVETPSAVPATEARGARSDPASLLGAHLFGVPDAIPAGDAAAVDVRLVGTVAFGRAGDGLALLAFGGAPIRVHRVGDRIGDGARLAGVWPDRVALSRGVTVSVVALPRLHARGTPLASAAMPPDTGPERGPQRNALVARARERAAAARALPVASSEPTSESPAAHHAAVLADRVRARGARLARAY